MTHATGAVLVVLFLALAALRLVSFRKYANKARRGMWFSQAMAAIYGAFLYFPSAVNDTLVPPTMLLHIRLVFIVLMVTLVADAYADWRGDND